MKPDFDIVIKDASQLVTCAGYYQKIKRNVKNLAVIENGYVLIKDGKIAEVGDDFSPTTIFKKTTGRVIDAKGKVVMPGFVDCHTHFVHGGFREDEFFEKVKGKSYLEILAAGGGILSTVRATRKASEQELTKKAAKVLDKMLEYGTTTVEGKTGYGLDLENEMKCMKVMFYMKHPITVVPTFMGAHAFPEEFKGKEEEYVEAVKKMMYSARGMAEFCDIFCEKGAFSKEQAKKILLYAKSWGFKLKMHTDELTAFNGAELAAEMKCISAEHLDMVSDEGIQMMAEKGVMAVLMPCVPYHLMTEKYAPVEKMIKAGMAVALATDYNPGSCPTKSMQTVIEMAVRKMKMGIEEAINASTINAAYAIGKKGIGRIMQNYDADMIILDIPNYKHLAYDFGTNKVETVIKKGEVVVENGKAAYTRR